MIWLNSARPVPATNTGLTAMLWCARGVVMYGSTALVAWHAGCLALVPQVVALTDWARHAAAATSSRCQYWSRHSRCASPQSHAHTHKSTRDAIRESL